MDSEAQPEEPEGGEQKSQADSQAPPEGAEAEDTFGDVVGRSNPHLHLSHFLVVTAIVVDLDLWAAMLTFVFVAWWRTWRTL